MDPRPVIRTFGYVWYGAAVLVLYGISLLGGWKMPDLDLDFGGGSSSSGHSSHSFGGK